MYIYIIASYKGYYSVNEESYVPEGDLIKTEDGYKTKLNEKLEYINEDNFSINLQDSLEDYRKLIEKKKFTITPPTLFNEVEEYIKSKYFVKNYNAGNLHFASI